MPTIAAGFVFIHHDRRRLQAVLLVAAGRQAGEVAALLEASRRWVTKTLARYRQRRRPDDWAERVRSGRPPLAPVLSSDFLTVALQADPLAFTAVLKVIER